MSESNFVNSKTTSLLDDKWNILQEQPFGKLQLEAAGAALAFGKYLWAEDLELWFSELSESVKLHYDTQRSLLNK